MAYDGDIKEWALGKTDVEPQRKDAPAVFYVNWWRMDRFSDGVTRYPGRKERWVVLFGWPGRIVCDGEPWRSRAEAAQQAHLSRAPKGCRKYEYLGAFPEGERP